MIKISRFLIVLLSFAMCLRFLFIIYQSFTACLIMQHKYTTEKPLYKGYSLYIWDVVSFWEFPALKKPANLNNLQV